eukprot:909798-Heterocapsa_arctica.AAC.1
METRHPGFLSLHPFFDPETSIPPENLQTTSNTSRDGWCYPQPGWEQRCCDNSCLTPSDLYSQAC